MADRGGVQPGGALLLDEATDRCAVHLRRPALPERRLEMVVPPPTVGARRSVRRLAPLQPIDGKLRERRHLLRVERNPVPPGRDVCDLEREHLQCEGRAT